MEALTFALYFTIGVGILSAYAGFKVHYYFLLVSATAIYIVSFFTGPAPMVFAFIFITLVIANSLKLISSMWHTFTACIFGILLWGAWVLLFDDYWLFYPLKILFS